MCARADAGRETACQTGGDRIGKLSHIGPAHVNENGQAMVALDEFLRRDSTDFTLTFVRNPYLYYTEHGLHAVLHHGVQPARSRAAIRQMARAEGMRASEGIRDVRQLG